MLATIIIAVITGFITTGEMHSSHNLTTATDKISFVLPLKLAEIKYIHVHVPSYFRRSKLNNLEVREEDQDMIKIMEF